jgi:hypothetical protein
VEDTWWSRDLPVLDAAVKLFQSQDYVQVRDLAKATGFEIGDVAQSLLDMRYVYVSEIGSMGDQADWDISYVTEKARRAVGQWPTPENVVGRLAAAFNEAAEHEPDPERKSKLQAFGGWLADTGQSIATEVITKVISQHTGTG